MTIYMVMTGDGNELCNGLQSEQAARAAAQTHADNLRETVYYCEARADAEEIAVQPTMFREFRNPHFIEVQRRLADIIEIREGDGDSIAYTAIEDPHDDDGEPVNNEAEDLLEEINRALAPEYRASWTGDGNGDESDVVIELVKAQ